MILHNIIFEFFLKLRILRALTCTLYLKNISFPGEMSSYFMSGQISPDYTEKIAHFRWKCPLKKCAPHFYRRWYHKTNSISGKMSSAKMFGTTSRLYHRITSIFGKMSTSFLFATSFLRIIPINYLISCKNVHDFVVRTISSDYIWNIAHFWEKCKHQRCHYNFLQIIPEKLSYFACIVTC